MTYTRDNGTTTPNLAGSVEISGGLRINNGTFVLTRCELFDGPPVRPSVTTLASDHGGAAGTPFYEQWAFVIEGYLTVPTLADVWAAKDDLRGAFNLNAGLVTLLVNCSGWSAARQVTARINGPIQFTEPVMLDKNVPDREFVIPMVALDPRLYSTTLQSVTVATGGTSLTNNGNMPAPFTVRFNGPQTSPMRLIDPNGKMIEVLSSPTSGHYTEVNTRDATNGTLTAVTDAGVSAYATVNDSDAVTIAPGTATWTRTNGGGAGTTVVSFRDAWA